MRPEVRPPEAAAVAALSDKAASGEFTSPDMLAIAGADT